MMASSSSLSNETPFEDDEIIETMSVVFDSNVDLLDLEAGIDLLGYLIADIEPGVGGVKATLLGIWRNLGQIRIVRAKKNVYSIRVGSEKLACKLIEGGPWNVKGFCFSIRHWPLYHSVDDIEPTRATYWIQAHGIPREMLSLSNGRKLGNMLGSVFEVEDPAQVGYRGFLRMRIDLDARKPLPTCVQLPCRSTTKRIRLQFELLKNFCFKCGRLGHMISVCNHQVNPLLVRMGVVYDQSLVAEPVQKPVFTLPHFPLEFPYIPRRKASDIRPASRRDTTGRADHQFEPVNKPSIQHMSRLQTDGDPSLASSLVTVHSDSFDSEITPPALSSVSLSAPINQASGSLTPRKRLDMWHPDTNGTMFRNGSITVAINGINLNSPSWADPNVIPPWAFKDRSEFARANPFYPVPGFENNSVLVPSSAQLDDCDPVELANSHITFKPATKRKRRAPHSSSVADDIPASSKKARPLLSPSLRLSNSRGGRRGGRRGSNNRGTLSGRGSRASLGKDNGVLTTNQDFLLPVENHLMNGANCISVSQKGMEDVTHLQGCGGWPKPAARNQ